ncbi:hypothetical protein J6590_028684 [Homalodisca vitripennis]|nr:hypothetical protein J6590_028684 [Homalodisca vitripennis]
MEYTKITNSERSESLVLSKFEAHNFQRSERLVLSTFGTHNFERLVPSTFGTHNFERLVPSTFGAQSPRRSERIIIRTFQEPRSRYSPRAIIFANGADDRERKGLRLKCRTTEVQKWGNEDTETEGMWRESVLTVSDTNSFPVHWLDPDTTRGSILQLLIIDLIGLLIVCYVTY